MHICLRVFMHAMTSTQVYSACERSRFSWKVFDYDERQTHKSNGSENIYSEIFIILFTAQKANHRKFLTLCTVLLDLILAIFQNSKVHTGP